MDDGYTGASYVEITDDEGSRFTLELLGSIEYHGEEYRVFLPADLADDDPDYGFIILKVVYEGDEEQFENVDDEDQLQEIYDLYMHELFDGDDDPDDD